MSARLRLSLLFALGAVVTAATGLSSGAVADPPSDGGPVIRATIPVGKNPIDVAIDATTHTAYVANPDDNTISVIDEATDAVTRTLTLATSPGRIAIDPRTRTMWVTNGDPETVTGIDEATGRVTRTVRVGEYPVDVAVDPDTGTVFVVNDVYNSVSVIDEATGRVTHTVRVGRLPLSVAVDPGTGKVFVGVQNYSHPSVNVIDEATDTVTDDIQVGSDYTLAVDVATHTVAASGGHVYLIDEATGTVTHDVGVVGNGAGAVAVDPSTATVYVPNGIGRFLSVLDEATGTVTHTVPIGLGNWEDMAVDPGVRTALIVNSRTDSVTVLTTRPPQPQTIRFTSVPPAHPVTGRAYRVTATGGGSGNPVTFTVDATTARDCTITGQGDSAATVLFTAPGDCIIDADQGGNGVYAAAAQAQQTVGGIAQGPVITRVNPATGPTAGGTTVTITGSGFIGTRSVQFGSGSYATGVTVVSDTQLTAVSPAHAAGAVNIRVVGTGVSLVVGADRFTFSPPAAR